MNAEFEAIPTGTALLYCSQCRTETVLKWVGKMVIKRCWRCDTMLEDRTNDGS